MPPKVESGKFFAGIVKAVPSGDTLVIAQNTTWPAAEKTITLASIMAPRLGRRGGVDEEPFAWASREYLRKLCIGKNVVFRVDYTVPTINREFGTVFFGDKNVAQLVVSQGLAKVKGSGQKKGEKSEASPFLEDLKRIQEQASLKKLGMWSGEREEAIRKLPPSAMGDSSTFDAVGFIATHKGIALEAIVEHVRDGSVIRVFLLPEFESVQVYVAGVQAPLLKLKLDNVESGKASNKGDMKAPTGSQAPTTGEGHVAKSSGPMPDGVMNPIGLEAKHFTEMRVLNRDVRIVPEGVDKYNNLIASVYYSDGETAKNLAMELVRNGFAKYVEWSANLMEADAKKTLKSAELQAKNGKLKWWINYKQEQPKSKAILDQNFTGKVIEVPTGDCIVVVDDSVPHTNRLAERRVYLSSTKCPKMGNPRSKEPQPPEPYAREARELLRQRLIGRQVHVAMEYSRVNKVGEEPQATTRVMEYGSVFIEGDDNTGTKLNIAEVLLARGFASVVKHRDYEERSNHYESLIAAEARAKAAKRGIHSEKDYAVKHIADRTDPADAKATKAFLPFLQKKKIRAVVEHIFSGHRFKLYLPEETSYIAFSLSGVRCPAIDQPYSDEAIAFMRRTIMNRDVEVQVETVDKKSTFLGSLYMSDTNMAVVLVQAGLANLQSFNMDRIPDGDRLRQAEQSAKNKKLKIWESFKEKEETGTNAPETRKRNKQEMTVMVTDIVDGERFYVQVIGDDKVASIQEKLKALSEGEAPEIDEKFNPKQGDVVLAQFHEDKSWNRALIVRVEPAKKEYEVFYMDYGNQEIVSYNDLRPLGPSIPSGPGLARLCKLAYIKTPNLSDDFGGEAGQHLSDLTINSPNNKFTAIVEEKDTSLASKRQGRETGIVLEVSLMYPEEYKKKAEEKEMTSIGSVNMSEIGIDDEEMYPSINKVAMGTKSVYVAKASGSKKVAKKSYTKIDFNEDNIPAKNFEKKKCPGVNAAMLQSGLARLERIRGPRSRDRKVALDELEAYEKEAKQAKLGMWEYGDVASDDEDKDRPARKAVAGAKK